LNVKKLYPGSKNNVQFDGEIRKKLNYFSSSSVMNGCNIYSINIILTKFHHLKTNNNENIEIPKTLTWSVTNERTDGRTDVQTEKLYAPYFVGGAYK
jgi:hypothetical protein